MDRLSSSSASYFHAPSTHKMTNLMWTINRLSFRCALSLVSEFFTLADNDTGGIPYHRTNFGEYFRTYRIVSFAMPTLRDHYWFLWMEYFELHETLEKLSPWMWRAIDVWRVLQMRICAQLWYFRKWFRFRHCQTRSGVVRSTSNIR